MNGIDKAALKERLWKLRDKWETEARASGKAGSRDSANYEDGIAEGLRVALMEIDKEQN